MTMQLTSISLLNAFIITVRIILLQQLDIHMTSIFVYQCLVIPSLDHWCSTSQIRLHLLCVKQINWNFIKPINQTFVLQYHDMQQETSLQCSCNK